jgi:hypothetical protein
MDDSSTPQNFESAHPVSHEAIMAALLKASHRTDEWRKSIERRMKNVEDAQDVMLKELQSNTVETVAARAVITDVRDAMTTARTLRRVVIWFGGLAAAVASVWALYTQAGGK